MRAKGARPNASQAQVEEAEGLLLALIRMASGTISGQYIFGDYKYRPMFHVNGGPEEGVKKKDGLGYITFSILARATQISIRKGIVLPSMKVRLEQGFYMSEEGLHIRDKYTGIVDDTFFNKGRLLGFRGLEEVADMLLSCRKGVVGELRSRNLDVFGQVDTSEKRPEFVLGIQTAKGRLGEICLRYRPYRGGKNPDPAYVPELVDSI